MTSSRKLLALGAIFMVPLAATGCGDSVPGDAVARVGDTVIKKETFDHWLTVGFKQSQPPGSKVQIPKPPEFTACVAAKKKAQPKPAKGQKAPTDKQLKTQCKQEYDGIKEQVLGFLISNVWLEGEAKELGIKISDKEVTKSFNDQKKQAFPKEKDFQDFLKNSGMTMEDLRLRVRISLLEPKIREKVTKGSNTVTAKEIQTYFEKNKKQFAQPERRDLLVILTKTEAKANEAKAALEGGASFKATAKKFSIDEATKSQGGRLLGVSKGQQEKALDDAVFKARGGVLTGPIKTQFGYYLFKVLHVKAAEEPQLSKVRTTIRQALVAQKQQKKLDEFVKDFRKKWQEETNCREGFVIENCKNAPKKDDKSDAPPGAVPTPTTQAPTQSTPQQ